MMKKRGLQGFTLIELMVVVGIIAVLIAIALPNYSLYTAQSQIYQVIALIKPIEAKVNQSIITGNQAFITDATTTATNTTNKYITSISINSTSGKITVTLSGTAHSAIQNKTIVFTPSIAPGGNVSGVSVPAWTCTTDGTVPSQYLNGISC